MFFVCSCGFAVTLIVPADAATAQLVTARLKVPALCQSVSFTSWYCRVYWLFVGPAICTAFTVFRISSLLELCCLAATRLPLPLAFFSFVTIVATSSRMFASVTVTFVGSFTLSW